MYRDPPRPPPVGVTVGGDGGDALIREVNQLPIVVVLQNYTNLFGHDMQSLSCIRTL